jgi:hypothetical protein
MAAEGLSTGLRARHFCSSTREGHQAHASGMLPTAPSHGYAVAPSANAYSSGKTTSVFQNDEDTAEKLRLFPTRWFPVKASKATVPKAHTSAEGSAKQDCLLAAATRTSGGKYGDICG